MPSQIPVADYLLLYNCFASLPLDFEPPSHLFTVQFSCRMLHTKLAIGVAFIFELEFKVSSKGQIVMTPKYVVLVETLFKTALA